MSSHKFALKTRQEPILAKQMAQAPPHQGGPAHRDTSDAVGAGTAVIDSRPSVEAPVPVFITVLCGAIANAVAFRALHRANTDGNMGSTGTTLATAVLGAAETLLVMAVLNHSRSLCLYSDDGKNEEKKQEDEQIMEENTRKVNHRPALPSIVYFSQYSLQFHRTADKRCAAGLAQHHGPDVDGPIDGRRKGQREQAAGHETAEAYPNLHVRPPSSRACICGHSIRPPDTPDGHRRWGNRC